MKAHLEKAMIHSLKEIREVKILEENGLNHVIAEYNGKRYKGIFNPFSMLYYVDDLYGEIKEDN